MGTYYLCKRCNIKYNVKSEIIKHLKKKNKCQVYNLEILKLSDNDIKVIFNNSKILTWGDYDIKKGKALKIIKKTTKLPKDYDRIFFIYSEDEDIYGNKVVKKELYEGSQKRFIYYVPDIQV